MTALQNSDLFSANNAFPEHQQINLITLHHCTYFKVSHPETTIRERQEIEYLQGRHCNYLKVC